MAEHAADLPQATEVPDRGGSFLFEPVGARTFVAPERFSEQQRQFFRTGAEFTRAEVIGKRERFVEHDYAALRELLAKAGELGLLGVDIGEEFSGLGLDKVTSCIVSENLAQGNASFSVSYGGHVGIGTLPIVFFGTEAQKRKYLPGLATGRLLACYALTEP
ncbi:MAG TPA: acyl-CoA dehydrogenase family protein, partial [Myxococcales bacterium]|nr:acyl-CoA dehydrogenase family protein [Myxococcales bacterium]